MQSRTGVLFFAVMMVLALPGKGRAEHECSAPLEDWQPREALARKLQLEGLTIQKMRIDDGCYLVWQVDAAGVTSVHKYDPATLVALPDEPGRHRSLHDHGEHDHGGSGGGEGH